MSISRTQIILLVLIIALAILFFYSRSASTPESALTTSTSQTISPANRLEFSTLNPLYRFSAELDNGWRAEYVPTTEAINIYNQGAIGSNLEKSQIFIRYFNANDFLTLTTVNILSRESTSINGHDAVRYEIEKKAGVANFANQPSWRSQRHSVVDIRFAETNPSVFYVIARNPSLSESDFEDFLQNTRFHND